MTSRMLNLLLAIFPETTEASIISYFSERCDAANFLLLFHKLDVICNSKTQFNSSSQLGNAAIHCDDKPEVFFVISWFWLETYRYSDKTNFASFDHCIKFFIDLRFIKRMLLKRLSREVLQKRCF